jgi:hypothetical protein
MVRLSRTGCVILGGGIAQQSRNESADRYADDFSVALKQ